jgi:hypothetical protein
MQEVLRPKIYRVGEIIKPFEDANPLARDEMISKLTKAYFGGYEDYVLLQSPIQFEGIEGELKAIAELEDDSVADRNTQSVNTITPFGEVGLNIRILNKKAFVIDVPLSLELRFYPRTWNESQFLEDYNFEIPTQEERYVLYCSGIDDPDNMEKFFKVGRERVAVMDWTPKARSLLEHELPDDFEFPSFRIPADIPILAQIPTRIVRWDDESDYRYTDLPQTPTLVPV